MNVHLRVALDCGASLSKAFYNYSIDGEKSHDGEVGFKTTCSSVRELVPGMYRAHQDAADDNTSLVSFGEGRSQSYWMVGTAAQEATLSLSPGEAKQETAIAKVLAMVGQLRKTLFGHLESFDLYLTLGLLLPIDEIGDREEMEKKLFTALKEFEHNGETVVCSLDYGIQISPEGYGIGQLVTALKGGVIVLGHRDASWIHVEDRSVAVDKSVTFAGWGMHRLVRKTQFTFKHELHAAHMIFAAGPNLKPAPLERLAPSGSLNRLIEALRDGRSQYWLDLKKKLSTTSFRVAEEVIVTGGNAYYWRYEIKALLGSRQKASRPIIKDLEAAVPRLAGKAMLYRAADCFAFFCTLPGVEVRREVSANV